MKFMLNYCCICKKKEIINLKYLKFKKKIKTPPTPILFYIEKYEKIIIELSFF